MKLCREKREKSMDFIIYVRFDFMTSKYALSYVSFHHNFFGSALVFHVFPNVSVVGLVSAKVTALAEN